MRIDNKETPIIEALRDFYLKKYLNRLESQVTQIHNLQDKLSQDDGTNPAKTERRKESLARTIAAQTYEVGIYNRKSVETRSHQSAVYALRGSLPKTFRYQSSS